MLSVPSAEGSAVDGSAAVSTRTVVAPVDVRYAAAASAASRVLPAPGTPVSSTPGVDGSASSAASAAISASRPTMSAGNAAGGHAAAGRAFFTDEGAGIVKDGSGRWTQADGDSQAVSSEMNNHFAVFISVYHFSMAADFGGVNYSENQRSCIRLCG